MAKISLMLADEHLAEIDAQAEGNRTAFMVAASLDRARKSRRAQIDAEIAESILSGAARDLAVYREWDATVADGLE
jgi:hypothetical protein